MTVTQKDWRHGRNRVEDETTKNERRARVLREVEQETEAALVAYRRWGAGVFAASDSEWI